MRCAASTAWHLLGQQLPPPRVLTSGPPRARHAQEVRRGGQAMKRMNAIIADLAAEIKARGPPKADDMSIAARLLRLTDPTTGRPLTDDRLKAEIMIFFIAGSETTGARCARCARPALELGTPAQSIASIQAGWTGMPCSLSASSASVALVMPPPCC